MRKFIAMITLLSCSVALAQEPSPTPGAKAQIRIAGIFIKKFSVWKAAEPNCAKPADKPWMFLDCGALTCAKQPLLNMPLELDYSNWRASPRVAEILIDSGKPFTLHLGGKYVHTSLAGGIAAAAGVPGTLNKTSCVFDLSFTPGADRMYEASIDPRGDGCALTLSEIRAPATGGEYMRVPVEGAVVNACPK
jgi:hypothetical protein